MLVTFSVLVILYMFLHSFLANNIVKKFFYKNVLRERYYRFLFVSYSILFLLPIGYIYIIAEKTDFYSSYLFSLILGWGLIFISGYVFFISFKNYNIREFLGIDRLNSKERIHYPLKISGVNRFVRHPLYSFSYTLMLGLFLIAPNNYILTASVITAIYLPIGIYFEEKKLILEYGEDYKEYIKKVPMLIPAFFSK